MSRSSRLSATLSASLAFAALGGALLAGCAPTEAPEPTVGERADAIRNGTREPQVIRLTEGEKLAIGWLHPAGQPGNNFCTGTLVHPRVVATAEHCISGQQGNRLGFGIGLDPSAPVASFRVQSAIAHPRVDAALLVLEQDAVAAVPELEPIAFNRAALPNALVGTEVEAGGYGETYDRNRSGRYFAVVQLIQIANDEIVVDGRGRQGICFGDSGGPVIANLDGGPPKVLGVESWGDPSCLGVDHLTRLDRLADWIDQNTPADPGGPVDPDPMEPEPDPNDACGGLDYLGRCDGDVAEWCGDGEIQRRDCARRGLVCAYVDDEIGYFCTDADPCEGVPPTGICDGDTVVRCRLGEMTSEHCGDVGEICVTDNEGAFCAEPSSGEPEPAPEPEPGEPEPAPEPEPGEPEPAPEPEPQPEPEPSPDAGVDGPDVVLVDAGPGGHDDDDDDGEGGGGGAPVGPFGCAAAPGAPVGGGLPVAGLVLGLGWALRRRRVGGIPAE